MKTIKQNLVIIFLAALVFCSCKKTEPKSTFDENLKIKMYETVDSTKRTLFFDCFTDRIYECSNYGIQVNYVIKGNKIAINFIRIIPPNICLTSLGPAYTLVKLEGLADKKYDMELNFGQTKITGQFNVSANSFKAILPTQTKVQFVNPDLERVPNNTIYGTINYHVSTTAPIVQSFIDSLQFYGATSILYPPGNYGNFQIDSTGQIKQIQDLGYYFTRYFIFNYSNNSSLLKKLVKKFGTNYPNDLLITLYTTKGETFYSWTP